MGKRSIVHIEIPAKNRETTAKFYGDLFGWEFEHSTQPAPYTTFRAENIGGGFPDIGDQYKPGDVVVYISSDDLDADLKQIEAHGGRALSPKMDVGDMGSLVFFADPARNRVALWKANGMQ
jgi:uncharacterized protein